MGYQWYQRRLKYNDLIWRNPPKRTSSHFQQKSTFKKIRKLLVHCSLFVCEDVDMHHYALSISVTYVYMGSDQNSFIRERPFFANRNVTFAKLSPTPCLSFAGPMLANNTSYEDSFTTFQITPENHGSLQHAASITESLLRADCCWLGSFWQGLLLETWKLGYCIWSLFLETSKSIIRQWQRQVQESASGPWRLSVAKPLEARLLPMKGVIMWLSTSTTPQGTEPEPSRNSLVPFSCRTPGGSGWQPFT